MIKLSVSIRTRLLRLAFATVAAVGTAMVPALAQDGRQVFRHDGLERTYFITVPDDAYRVAGGVPLVVVLHGAGGNGPNVINMTGFDELALEEGFIAVFPEGTTRGIYIGDNLFLTWNAGHCCGPGMNEGADDIGFLTELIDEIIETYPVDQSRLYLAGHSNGGMMTHRLAIELSDRVAAIGTVVGAMFGDELIPPSPVSAIIINGAEDELIPVAGGDIGVPGLFRNAWDGTPLAPSEYQAAFWALANNCIEKPAAVEAKPTHTLTWFACGPGISVEYYVVEDNGHAWPGNDTRQATDAFDATEVIWNFLRVHSLVAHAALDEGLVFDEVPLTVTPLPPLP